jgi:hypothetical protein
MPELAVGGHAVNAPVLKINGASMPAMLDASWMVNPKQPLGNGAAVHTPAR